MMEHTTWKLGCRRRIRHKSKINITFKSLLSAPLICFGPVLKLTHCVLGPVGTNEEEQLRDEQVGPQVAVDGAVVCVPGCPLAAQGGKAGGQTHQGDRDADPGNHMHEKLLHTDPELKHGKRWSADSA